MADSRESCGLRELSSDISLKILSKSLGSTVLVRLRGGKLLRGILQGYDQHMNLVLEEAEEVSDENSTQKRLGTIVVRGDNVMMISPTIKEGEER